MSLTENVIFLVLVIYGLVITHLVVRGRRKKPEARPHPLDERWIISDRQLLDRRRLLERFPMRKN
jgi:hypothetical protein